MGKAKECGGQMHQEVKYSTVSHLQAPSCPYTCQVLSLFTLKGVNYFSLLFYHIHMQLSTHKSNKEYASEGNPSNGPQNNEIANKEDMDKEERQEILEPISKGNPTLNARGFLLTSDSEDVDMTRAPESINFDEVSTDLNIQNSTNEVPSPQVSASLPSIEIPQTGL